MSITPVHLSNMWLARDNILSFIVAAPCMNRRSFEIPRNGRAFGKSCKPSIRPRPHAPLVQLTLRSTPSLLPRALLFCETFVAGLYGLRTVGFQGVPPGGGVAKLSYCQPYELALRRGRFRRRLSEGVIGHEQDSGGQKQRST